MTLITVISAKGSPGVTTTAAALTALEASHGGNPLLVEFDPSGGTTALDAQIPLNPGLLSLSAAARRGLDQATIDAHTQLLANGSRVLVAPTSPDLARSATTTLASGLADVLRSRYGLTVIDGGRWDHTETIAAMLAAADVVLVLLRPNVVGAEHVHARLESLRRINPVVSVACVGHRPYPPTEVATALDVAPCPAIETDERSAELVRAGAPVDRWLARTPLLRSARTLLDDLTVNRAAGVAI